MAGIQLNLVLPADPETIKAEVAKLQEQVRLRESEISILNSGILHYRRQCNHEGQKTGYNERDGDWASPCPTCGESH